MHQINNTTYANFFLRIIVWTGVASLGFVSLALNKAISDESLRVAQLPFRENWVLLEKLDPKIVELAEYVSLDRKRFGFLDAHLYNYIVPKRTRLELGIQGVEELTQETKFPEFAYLLFGQSYRVGLAHFARSTRMTSQEFQATLKGIEKLLATENTNETGKIGTRTILGFRK